MEAESIPTQTNYTSNSMNNQNFEVAIELFDGPIDLLLHLVKVNELPIEKISLALIAEQYISYVSTIKLHDFDLVGEYLVIATTLLSIKASVLLNDPIEDDAFEVLEAKEKEDENDPHELLLQKLKEAAVFKENALKLASREILGLDVFPAAASTASLVSEVKLAVHEPFLLSKAIKKLIDKNKDKFKSISFTFESVSITATMVVVLDKVNACGDEEINFEQLVDLTKGIPGVIVSFISILELSKRMLVRIRQNDVFDEIFVKKYVAEEYKELEREAV